MMYNGEELTHPDAIRAAQENIRMSALAIISSHSLVTIGSVTKRGGVVHTATSKMTYDNFEYALVGDEILYADGEIAYITSGAGFGLVIDGKSCAIEGSHVSNGDVIEKSRHPGKCVMDIREGMPPIPGFLQEGYVPPPNVAPQLSQQKA
ncbi:putative Zn-binding protein involved in type VI secretion [Oxalobacteraceae bacterium GrIS 1.11]